MAQFGGAVGNAANAAGAVAAGVASAQQIAARLMQQTAPGTSTATPAGGLDVALPHFEADLEINDFPQHARWKARTQHVPRSQPNCRCFLLVCCNMVMQLSPTFVLRLSLTTYMG